MGILVAAGRALDGASGVVGSHEQSLDLAHFSRTQNSSKTGHAKAVTSGAVNHLADEILVVLL